MTERIVVGSDGRKYITTEPLLHQHEALRLAAALETLSPLERSAAAELRRLHKEEQISAHAKRLALELECLLLDANHPAVSRWWDSAHEALEQYRSDVNRLYPQEYVSPLGKD